MEVQITPHFVTGSKPFSSVALLVGSTHATVLCEANDKHELDFKYPFTRTRLVAVTLSVPSSAKARSKIYVWAKVEANQIDPTSARDLSLLVKATKKSTAHSGGSGSGSNTTPSSPGNLPLSSSGSTSVPPPKTSDPVLPSIPQTQATPSTAANPVVNTGNSPLMRNAAEGGDELTFDQLASTQAAWLAALVVAFSLLLTQIRLGRVNLKSTRPKGEHRRTRKGGRAH